MDVFVHLRIFSKILADFMLFLKLCRTAHILHSANLSEANLSSANLNFAILGDANFSCARFSLTTLGWVDLRSVKALDTLIHDGPSTININTVRLPEGDTHLHLLRGVGFSDIFIDYLAHAHSWGFLLACS
jgi:hypothetical protein